MDTTEVGAQIREIKKRYIGSAHDIGGYETISFGITELVPRAKLA